MSVGRLRSEMSNDEVMRWSVYYARRAQDEALAAKLAEAKAARRR